MNCLACNGKGKFIGKHSHGALEDYLFECECGAKWQFITEQKIISRLQVEFPRGKHMIMTYCWNR